MGNYISNKITIHGNKIEIHELIKKIKEDNNNTFLSSLSPLPLGGNIPLKSYEDYFHIFQISNTISEVTNNSFSFWVSSKNKPPYLFFESLIPQYDNMNIIIASDDYLSGVAWIWMKHQNYCYRICKKVGWQKNYVTNPVFYNLQYFTVLSYF